MITSIGSAKDPQNGIYAIISPYLFNSSILNIFLMISDCFIIQFSTLYVFATRKLAVVQAVAYIELALGLIISLILLNYMDSQLEYTKNQDPSMIYGIRSPLKYSSTNFILFQLRQLRIYGYFYGYCRYYFFTSLNEFSLSGLYFIWIAFNCTFIQLEVSPHGLLFPITFNQCYNNKIINIGSRMKQMALKSQRQSQKNKIGDREPLQEQKKMKNNIPTIGHRAVSKQLTLRFDINTLLSLFNEMDITSIGAISKKGICRILQTIGVYNQQHHFKQESYTFDHFLSIMGQIEVPAQPSIYVLSFVKILAHYRDKSLTNDELGLQEAQDVQEKIKQISKNELQRQKIRIKNEHNRIYQQMQISQEQQLHSFETQWQNYLKQFKEQTSRRLQQTKSVKKEKIIEQSNKFLSKVKRSSVITSPRLIELKQKRKWLIKQKRYDNAIEIDNEIDREKRKLSGYQVEVNDQVLNKKLQKLNKTTNRYLGCLQKNLQVNLNKLMSKKKQGQNIMRIRMKNLREEANRKLSEHYRSEMNRLRSSFYGIANN